MSKFSQNVTITHICGHRRAYTVGCLERGKTANLTHTPCPKCRAFQVCPTTATDVCLGQVETDGSFTPDTMRRFATDGRCSMTTLENGDVIIAIPKGYIHSIAVKRDGIYRILYNATDALKK